MKKAPMQRAPSAEDKLYEMPPEIAIQREAIAAKQDEFTSSGGPMAFGTGIAEVELPVVFKLKNIEVRCNRQC